MLFKNITILNENFEISENQYVVVCDKKITYVGDKEPKGEFGRVYDGKSKLLMSAFYNAHGHTPMTLMRGYGENMALQDWLNKKVFPFEDQLDSESVYYGTLLSMAESMRYGICATNDMYYFIDDIVRAVMDSGEKSNVSRSIVHFSDSDPWELPSMKEMKRTFESYNGMDDGRILMDTSIHAEYSSNPLAVKAVADYANENKIGFQVHASETKDEHEKCKAKYGMTPIQYFNSFGAWDTRGVAAHCVWLDEEDYAILKEKNVTVSVNPISNLKLASGICNTKKLLEKGINVALGTDSVASNNSLDFFEEMKFMALLPKVLTNDPTAVTPKEVLYAATRGGALSMGRTDCGLLKEGFRADLIVVDISKANMNPVHSLENSLVYSASGTDVLMTMVDGKVLYENGEYKTLDIEKTIFEANLKTKQIIDRL